MKVLASLVALLFATPAFAQSSVCWPLDLFVEKTEEAGGTVYPVRRDAVDAAVRLYNETPPVSDFKWTLVIAVERPDRSAAFWYGNGGEVCNFLAIEAPTWAKIRDRFIGRAA